MHIAQFGPYRVALGLEWVNSPPESFDAEAVIEAFASKHQVNHALARYVRLRSGMSGMVGLMYVDSGLAARGLVSLAAAAAAHHDGLYVAAPSEHTELWVCAVRDGLVVREEMLPRDKARAQIDARLSMPGTNFKVFITDGLDLVRPGCSTFKPEDLVAAAARDSIVMARLKLMRGQRRSIMIAAAAVPATIVAILLFMRANKQPDVAELRQQAIAAYVSGASASIGKLPRSSRWLLAAKSVAMSKFDPFIGGMALGEVECTPTKCDGAYVPVDAEIGYSVESLVRAYGSHATVKTSGRKVGVQVTFDLPTESAQIYAVNAAFLSKPPDVSETGANPIYNWVGEVPLIAPSVQIKGVPKVQKLAGGQAYGFPPIQVEQVALEGRGDMDAGVLHQAYAALEYGAFKATRLNWSPGIVGYPGWRLAAERVVRPTKGSTP